MLINNHTILQNQLLTLKLSSERTGGTAVLKDHRAILVFVEVNNNFTSLNVIALIVVNVERPGKVIQ
jgi:hypothetical protein